MAFSDLASEGTLCHFCCILLVIVKTLRQTQVQGKGTQTTCLNEKSVKEFSFAVHTLQNDQAQRELDYCSPSLIFKSEKMMLLKCCTQYASKFGKFSSGHRTGKGQFYPNSKERQCQRMFKLPYCCTHFTCQLDYAQDPSTQALAVCEPKTFRCTKRFRKGRGTRDAIANICWIIEKAREFQKIIYFCFMDYIKAFDCVDHNKLENS